VHRLRHGVLAAGIHAGGGTGLSDPLFQCADPLLELLAAGDTGRGKARQCNSARNIG
jgi:hypothetical protein